MPERESDQPAADEQSTPVETVDTAETESAEAETLEAATEADAPVAEANAPVAEAEAEPVVDAESELELDDSELALSDEDEPELLSDDEIARWELARSALLEITEESTIGAPSDEVDEGEGVISYLFENLMPGYPGWKWTVTLAQVEDSAPTVLEAELTPAEDALLAPDWVPWADRMDDYRAAQIALGELSESDDEEIDEADEDVDALDDDESEDDSEDDESDDDEEDEEFDNPVLHAGDLDGVDIDELDDAAADVTEPGDTAGDAEPAAEAEHAAEAEPAEVKAEPTKAESTKAEPVTADDDARWAEPAAEPVRRARKPRRASSASIAQTSSDSSAEDSST